MPLEALRYDVTPVGMHYLLIHWDIPQVSAGSWRLEVGGSVQKRQTLALDDLKKMPRVSLDVRTVAVDHTHLISEDSIANP